MMTTANCFNDDSLELAARLLCSICREVDASFIIGSLCGSAITNQGSHQTCEAQTSVAPGHFNGGENFVFSGGSCLCNDVHSKVDEGSNKSIGEMESNGSDECHAEVSVQDSNEKKPSLINLFPPSSLITLWRLFVDTSLLEYLKSVASQRNTLSMVPGYYKQSKDISTNRYKNLDRFSLSYLSTRRIAAAVMNAVDLLEDIISNRASNGASHSFTDSTKLLSEVIQLATVESQLRSALYEDTLLESRRLGIGFDISRDHPFDGPSHFVLSKKNAKMDIELYNRSNLKYSHHMLPAEASRGYPFFLLSLKRSNDASYDEFYRRLLNDIADHDLCSLCVKLNDCISSSLLCHKEMSVSLTCFLIDGALRVITVSIRSNERIPAAFKAVISIFNMDFIFDNIITMYNLELYEDVIMLLEVCASDILGLSKSQFTVLTAVAADSYFQCGHYTKSQLEYYRALRIIKSLSEPLSNPKFCEAELKYRLYCCLMKQNKKEEAMGVLGSIPEHDMTPKVKAALARLHSVMDVREQKNTSETTSNALLFHKKVVEECPFAFLSLSFVVRNGIKTESNGRWSITALAWLEAQEAVSVHNYRKAVEILNKVADNNLRIIVEIGRLYYVYGERQKATNYLQRAHNIDPCYTNSMSILAYIYAQDHKLKELESLGANLMLAAESSEAWIAYGFLAKCQGKHDSALFFAQKACMLSESQADPMAMLLKALVFMDKRKYDEAVKHLRDALIYDPQNYDLYETLVQAYSEQHRPNEARLTANHCRHHLGQDNARALYLCAKVAAKDEGLVNEAQVQLEKAVSLSPHLLDAVHLLVELYDRKKNYDKAISLLKKQTEITVDSRLHQLLGDILAKSSQLDAACDQYNLVGIFDPKSITSAMSTLESAAGMSTPEPPITTVPPCPAAPRRRGASHIDALSSTAQRNS